MTDDGSSVARPTDNGPLPQSQKALERARRLLDHLATLNDDNRAYRDQLPFALDGLLHVWRTINKETQGRRSQAFGNWWKTQLEGNHDSIRRLRNIEMKDGSTVRQSRLYRGKNEFRVNADGSHDAVRADGTIAPRLPGGGLDAGEMVFHSASWEFVVPGLEGRTVDEILELVYKRLTEEVLPTAESYFAPVEKSGGTTPD
jgi:hypothetical protein